MKNESNLNFSIVQPGSEKEHWYTWPPVTWPQRKAQREKPSGRSETSGTASGRTSARLRHPEAQQGRESPRFEDEGSPNLRMDLRPCLVLNVGHQDRKNDTCKLLCLGTHTFVHVWHRIRISQLVFPFHLFQGAHSSSTHLTSRRARLCPADVAEAGQQQPDLKTPGGSQGAQAGGRSFHKASQRQNPAASGHTEHTHLGCRHPPPQKHPNPLLRSKNY